MVGMTNSTSGAAPWQKRHELVFTLDVNIYATNDVLAATQEIPNVFINGRPVVLYDLKLQDDDDQGTAVDLIFLRSNTAIGAENDPYAPTDAIGREILKEVSILATDWVDKGDYRTVDKTLNGDDIGVVLEPTSGRSLYVGAVCRSGTPTHTVNGLRLWIGVIPRG